MSKTKIQVPIMADLAAQKQLPEYLFWVGCAGSYDERYKKVTRAFAKILHYLNISYGILGNEERCTGDPAKRAGNEFLFQAQAMQNIELMNGYQVKKIFTACPHCYNTLKNEYPELGGQYQVTHHTQFLLQMLNQGKLSLAQEYLKGKAITFHDPCYLGRGNNEYQAPRTLLTSLSSELVEMQRNKHNSFCCGAGGAQMFKETEHGSTEINLARTEEALALKPKVIATACPFCLTMLTDGVKTKQQADAVQVKDIAELICDALEL